jgi:sulfonate transport system substrate-binding protein
MKAKAGVMRYLKALTASVMLAAVTYAFDAGATEIIDKPPPLPAPVQLRVGAANDANAAPLARIADVLKSMNVEFTLVQFARYADERTAMVAGSLDIATMGCADLPIALSQGATNVMALMGVGTTPKFPVARKEVKLDTWADLKGKRIAVAPGSSVWFQFVATLEEQGVPYNELKAVNIQGGGSNFDQALQRGDVDAIITWEPFESTPVNDGYGYFATNLDYSKSKAVGDVAGIFAASKSAVTEKREAVRRFIWAVLNAQNELMASKEALAAGIQAYTNVSPAAARSMAEHVNLNPTLSLDQMKRQAAAFHKLDVIQKDVSGELDKYYAGDLVRSVMK